MQLLSVFGNVFTAPRLEASASQVRLDHARARVRIRGVGVGLLRCGSFWKLCAGPFAMQLLIPNAAMHKEIEFYGLRGVARCALVLDSTHHVTPLRAQGTQVIPMIESLQRYLLRWSTSRARDCSGAVRCLRVVPDATKTRYVPRIPHVIIRQARLQPARSSGRR